MGDPEPDIQGVSVKKGFPVDEPRSCEPTPFYWGSAMLCCSPGRRAISLLCDPSHFAAACVMLSVSEAGALESGGVPGICMMVGQHHDGSFE